MLLPVLLIILSYQHRLVPGTGRNRSGASDLSVRLFLSSRLLQLRRQPRPVRSLSSEGHAPDSSDAGHHSLRAYSPVLLSRQTPLLQPHLQLPVGWPSPVSSQSVSSLSLISSALHPVLSESGTLLQNLPVQCSLPSAKQVLSLPVLTASDSLEPHIPSDSPLSMLHLKHRSPYPEDSGL